MTHLPLWAAILIFLFLMFMVVIPSLWVCPLLHSKRWDRYGDGDNETIHCRVCGRTWRQPR
jgi:hypothetical protein